MIRPLVEVDRPAILDLLDATGNFNEAEIGIAAELIDIILTNPAQKDYYGFVDDIEGVLSGFLIIGPVPATVGSWHMYWIAVHPKFHGRGVARALDQWAESFALERHAYWLLAETSSQPGYERARAFYQKQGYSILAQIPDYYRPSDDLVIFGKRL